VRSAAPLLLDDDRRADLDPVKEIDHVLIGHANAARWHRLTDFVRLVRAVNAIEARSAIMGSASLLMFKKWNRAPKRFSHHIGVIDVAQPASTDVPDLLKRIMPFPIRAKQLERHKEPLFTALSGLFHIAAGYGVLQVQKSE
jgi:hypothetical protein